MINYYNPVNIIFGENTFSKFSKVLENKKYIIITHPEEFFNQYTNQLLQSSNPPIKIFNQVLPNPDYLDLLNLINNFSCCDKKIDSIVAIGGGSVIDSAKVLAAFKSNKKLLINFVRGKKISKIDNPLDIIAVPTTSGTSSELTCWATIWDKEKNNKLSLTDKSLYPKKAIIDPTIMIAKTKQLTIATGLDALSHSMESIWNLNANPISSFHAINGAKIILENLPNLVNDLQNLQLRSNLALACVHAGLAFSNTKTAISHNISYPITLQYRIPHGIACSFSLPFVMRSMKGINKDAEAQLEKIFDNDLINSSTNLLNNLRNLNVPTSLSELKISQKDWHSIVTSAFEGERGKNFLGNMECFDKACKEMGFFNEKEF